MSHYLLIETKSPLDGGQYAFELGGQLREVNHDVTVYLLQDAVLAARRNFKAGEALLADAGRHHLTVFADEVALRERGVTGERLAPAVRKGGMGDLVDFLMERSDRAIWH